jgi:hypothetical protein
MQRAAHDRLVSVNIAVSYFQVETAIRVSTNPGFELYRSALTPKIRKRHEVTGVTFLTLGEIELFHGVLLPTDIIN